MTPTAGVLLAPELLGPAARYRVMAQHGPAMVDATLHFDKRRKAFHRFTIADTRGPLDVTIPVAKPQSHATATYADILISDHSPWWLTMMTSLESAYGRTPFYEFYADDFAPLIGPHRVGTPMAELCSDLDSLVCRLLDIPAPRWVLSQGKDESIEACANDTTTGGSCDDMGNLCREGHVLDLRRAVAADFASYELAKPYWQVRGDTLGFIPGLSILDLLFNLGPEAQLLIHA